MSSSQTNSKVKLEQVFINMKKNKKNFIKAKSGDQFEDILESEFKKVGLTKLSLEFCTDDEIIKFVNKIKPDIQNKIGAKIINNELSKPGQINFFISQPYGTQNYPDFLIFTEDKVFAIETKFSSKSASKPLWNGNLPKHNGIYIFGSYGKGDLTFFKGSDVLEKKEREYMVEFFESTTKLIQDNFKKMMLDKFNKKEIDLDRGFNVYIRTAFEQTRSINPVAHMDFFTHPKRDRIEDKLIRLLTFAQK